MSKSRTILYFLLGFMFLALFLDNFGIGKQHAYKGGTDKYMLYHVYLNLSVDKSLRFNSYEKNRGSLHPVGTCFSISLFLVLRLFHIPGPEGIDAKRDANDTGSRQHA